MTGGTNEGAERNDDRGVDEVHGGDDWTEGENCLFFNISGAGTLIPGSQSTEVARKYLLLLGCGILALSRKDELLQPLVFS